MIGYLRGNVKFISEAHLILECNGVGYKVEMGNIDFLEGTEQELFIYTHVREQELRLFGFKAKMELDIFEKLLGVSGVGPKVAMQLVSQVGAVRIIEAIQGGQAVTLKVSGVGLKTAEKIIIELKNKLSGLEVRSTGGNLVESGVVEEAIEAMEGLGYKRYEIENILKNITIGDDWSSEDIIKILLRDLKKDGLKR